MSSNAALARARRRYKILCRERVNLTGKDLKDSVVEDELQKLELEFPELKADLLPPHVSSSAIDSSVPAAVASSSAEDLPLGVDGVTGTRATSASTIDQPSASQPSKSAARAMPSRDSSQYSTEELSPNSKGPAHLEIFSMYVFRFYTALHHRSLFGPLNFAKIVIVSSLIAVAHCFLVDPCSDFGVSLQPSFFCVVIHVGNLYSTFLRRPDALSVPMLAVYIVLDVLPSVALALVSYSLTLCILNVCGAPRVPIACPY